MQIGGDGIENWFMKMMLEIKSFQKNTNPKNSFSIFFSLGFEGKYFHEPFPLFSLNLFIVTPLQPLELFIPNFMVFLSLIFFWGLIRFIGIFFVHQGSIQLYSPLW